MQGPVTWRSRVRLVDEVAEELRERIYSGDYALGTKLRQETLAEELQVSRTPLREAMRVLESEGLLHSEPGRGVRVISADVDKLLRAYRLREVIDGLACRLAAESPDASRREALAALIEPQELALNPWDAGAYTRENVAFHIAIMEIADNEYVLSQAHTVRMTSQVFTPVALLEFGHARTAVNQHYDIAEAIAGGDGDAAEEVGRAHIRTTINRISTNERLKLETDG